jgi:polysaccharide export outer membrane protein/exopolysaccharide production protein ExoF
VALAAAISEQLRVTVGLIGPVETSVEISRFRPIYILGDVQNPGEYEYRPEITVLQVVSLAGGPYRPPDAGLAHQNAMISAIGSVDVLGQQINRATMRRARLQAEAKDESSVPIPDGLLSSQNEAVLRQMREEEQAILDARSAAFRSEVEARETLKSFLERQVVSLAARIDTGETQVALATEELDGIKGLVDRGLATSGRQRDLERLVAELTGQRIDWERTLLQARQQISEADAALLALRNTRRTETASALQETEAELQRLVSERDTAQSLLLQSRLAAVGAADSELRLAPVEPVYSIIRREGGEAREMSAEESTTVSPGDVVKVDSPLLASDGEPSLGGGAAHEGSAASAGTERRAASDGGT